MTLTTELRWSAASTFEATGVHAGYRTAPMTKTEGHRFTVESDGPTFTPEEIRRAWWALLEPGGYIIPHIDASPWYTRWHYPTEPAGFVWQNGVTTEPTEPFPITHWEPHAVWNPTTRPRVHLMIDLIESPPDLPAPTGLVLCDMIPGLEDLL